MTEQSKSIIEEIGDSMRRKALEEEARKMLPDFKEKLGDFMRRHLPHKKTSDERHVSRERQYDYDHSQLGVSLATQDGLVNVEIYAAIYPFEDVSLRSSPNPDKETWTIQVDKLPYTLRIEENNRATLGFLSPDRVPQKTRHVQALPSDLQRFSDFIDVLDAQGINFRGHAPVILSKSNRSAAPVKQ